MTESDDPGTALLIAGGISAGAAAGGAFGGGPKLPKQTQTAANSTKTAEALPQDSEAAIKNRRKKASLLTKDFGTPVLGKPGLLGLNEV